MTTFSPAEDNRMLGVLKDHRDDENNAPLRLPTTSNVWWKFSAEEKPWFISHAAEQTWEGPPPTGESSCGQDLM